MENTTDTVPEKSAANRPAPCATLDATSRCPVKLRKRIGSTTYLVSVHFSNSNRETMEDKFLRLMEREVNDIA